ncbi:hypothetical protein BJD12_02710 [Xanthomonas vesicatoria ATCC 35937]|nr:hypothetical protein BJD12_02710 [Xanthomonas vesicatoria ATCC 35937]
MLKPRAPTNSAGPCPLTVAGPYAAWMPRKSLQGRTCSVSREGGRARTLQPSRRPSALKSDITSRQGSNPFPIPDSSPAPAHAMADRIAT